MQTRQFTPADYYKISQVKTKKLVDAGMLDQAQSAAQSSMKFFADSLQLDEKTRMADANKAVSGIGLGDFSGVKEMYNKWLPNGYDITNITQDKDGSFTIHRINKVTGKEAEPLPVPDKQSLVAGVMSIADGKALIDLEQRKFENYIRQRQLANSETQTNISGGQLSLAQQRESREVAEKKATQDAAGNYYAETNKGATPTAIEAVRRGIFPAVPKPGEYKLESGDVTQLLGKPAANDKGEPIMDAVTGKQAYVRDPVAESQYFDWAERNGITDTNKGMPMFLAQRNRPQFKAEAEAEAAVKAGKIKPGQLVNIAGKQFTWK